jgi:hypothetical protein
MNITHHCHYKYIRLNYPHINKNITHHCHYKYIILNCPSHRCSIQEPITTLNRSLSQIGLSIQLLYKLDSHYNSFTNWTLPTTLYR